MTGLSGTQLGLIGLGLFAWATCHPRSRESTAAQPKLVWDIPDAVRPTREAGVETLAAVEAWNDPSARHESWLAAHELAPALLHTIAQTREYRLAALALLAAQARTQPQVFRYVDDPDPAIRAAVADCLGVWPTGSRNDSLLATLTVDPSPTVRIAANRAHRNRYATIDDTDEPHPPSKERLLAIAYDPMTPRTERDRACRLLLPHGGVPNGERLLRGLQNPSENVLFAAAPSARGTDLWRSTLAFAVERGDSRARVAAVRLLHEEGRSTPRTTALLRGVASGPVDHASVAAVQTLIDLKLPVDAELTAARQDLNSSRPFRRLRGCEHVWVIEQRASYLIPVLRALIEGDGDRDLREETARILRLIGPDAAPLVPDIVAALETVWHDPAQVRLWFRVLGSIGPAASSTRPLIEPYARHPHTAAAAIRALRRLSPDS